MVGGARGIVGLCIAAVACGVGGCDLKLDGSKAQRPPTVPSERDITRIRETTAAPTYWLGPRYAGRTLSGAVKVRGRWAFQYGTQRCDTSGCNFAIGVGTSPTRDLITNEPVCWERVGRGWLVGCVDRDFVLEEFEVLSGSSVISLSVTVDEIDRRALMRSLRRIDDFAGPRGLQTPTRFTCREARRFPRRFRVTIPEPLRPRCGS